MKLARKLNILSNCHFLGGRNDVPRFLLSADLLVHPAYHENTGTVLLEALCAGLPVLTTDVCGYAGYILAANAGLVLPSPFAQTAMNTSLLSMLLSEHRALWGKNATQFAKNADIYNLPQRAVDVLEAILKGDS
jgi:UDP-glucose:(heptosyl)LPS alpha-1,3-glucosyltransferase